MGEGVEQRGSPHGFGEVYAAEGPEALFGEEVDRGAHLLSWLSQNRRLSKDYERLPDESSEALIYAAMSRLMARRLARS
jgi:hypothetical protein